MSAALVRDFFPGVERFLGPTLWTFVFPTRVEQLCPRPQLSLQTSQERTLTLMWPAATICCVLGVVIGISYGASLLCQTLTSNAKKGTFTWGWAFLWYGMMSTGGLFYHCLYQQKMFYLLDVVSTACTCISILAVYWSFLHTDDRNPRFRSLMMFIYGVLAYLTWFGGDTIRNLLYFVPASLAFLVGAYFVVVKVSQGVECRSHACAWLACACTSALIGLASIPLDAWLCVTLGSNFSLLFWFFLGCDLAMVCLYHFTSAVSETNAAARQPPKSKPL